MIQCTSLGQAGFRLQCASAVLLIDPYLSDSVEHVEGAHQKRLIPVWKLPSMIEDVDWVLITHDHLDHCDPATLLPLAKASQICRFVGPSEVCSLLTRSGIDPDRVVAAPRGWLSLAEDLRIHATPAAHPTIELDAEGGWRCVGYLIEIAGRRIYHSGDTALATTVLDYLEQFKPIDVAMLPVNERNYFRERAGIIGNMSVREAFGFAELLGARRVVPMHWDMFKANTVYREEIELVYRLAEPPFELVINPDVL